MKIGAGLPGPGEEAGRSWYDPDLREALAHAEINHEEPRITGSGTLIFEIHDHSGIRVDPLRVSLPDRVLDHFKKLRFLLVEVVSLHEIVPLSLRVISLVSRIPVSP